jgi:shikimate dehydrogenase
MPITAATRTFALLGDPVRHSLSPVFQNAAFRELGMDAVYVALRCTRRLLPSLMRALADAGAGGNVTLPHKEAAAAAADRLTAEALRTGACNTFWGEGGRLVGDNTDVAGVRRAVQELAGDPAGCQVLLLGAGGAARAAACALMLDGARAIHVWNRTPARARALVEALDPDGTLLRLAPAPDPAGFDLLINATAAGLDDGDPLPWEPGGDGGGPGALLDLVYRPGGTRLVAAAAAAGIPAADGLGMLLHQGAAAFSRWTGAAAPVAAMRAALARAAALPC